MRHSKAKPLIVITEDMSRTERVSEFKRLLDEGSLQFDAKLSVMKRQFRHGGLLSSKYSQVLDSSNTRITVYLRRVSRSLIDVVPTVWITFPRGYWELIGSFPQGFYVFDEHFFQQLPPVNNGGSMQSNVEKFLFTKEWNAAKTPGGTLVFKHENYVALGMEQDGFVNWNTVMVPNPKDPDGASRAVGAAILWAPNQAQGIPDMERFGQLKTY